MLWTCLCWTGHIDSVVAFYMVQSRTSLSGKDKESPKDAATHRHGDVVYDARAAQSRDVGIMRMVVHRICGRNANSIGDEEGAIFKREGPCS